MNNSKPTKFCSTTPRSQRSSMLSPTPHLSQHQHPKVLEPLEGDPAKQQCAKASHHPEAGFLCRILRHKTAPLFTVRVGNVIIWTANELCIQKKYNIRVKFSKLPVPSDHNRLDWTYFLSWFFEILEVEVIGKCRQKCWEVDAGIHPEVYRGN